MIMKADKDTVQWLARIVGAATPVTVQSVGNGPYGLMEVTQCEDTEDRVLRFLGFASADEASEFATFVKLQSIHQDDRTPMSSNDRAKAQATVLEHVTDHVRFLPVCMNYAVTNATLDEMLGTFAVPKA